jgi:hypothetical protein
MMDDVGMPLIWSGDVFPLHAQISLLNSDWQGYPDWSGGKGRVALGGTGGGAGVAVETALDVDSTGPIRVHTEVWSPGDDANLAGLVRIHNGILVVDEHGIRVGNEEARDIQTLDLEPGFYWLEVWAEPDAASKTVIFVLGHRGPRWPGGMYVHARVTAWVSDDVPGFVKLELVDSSGGAAIFIDKVPVVDELGVLSPTTDYPVDIWVACEIVADKVDGDRGLARISTSPWGLMSTEDLWEFVVRRDQLMSRDKPKRRTQ